MDWREKYASKLVSMDEAVRKIKSGDTLCAGIATGVPYKFLDALADYSLENLENVEFYHGAGFKPYKLGLPQYNGHLNVKSFFYGPVERAFVGYGSHFPYQPIHLSQTTRDRTVTHRGNVLLAAGTEPDENGMISLGPSPMGGDMLDYYDTVIVQVNKQMPYVYGEGAVNNSKKTLMPGKTVLGFSLGSREMYDFMDHNHDIEARPFAWVNDPRVIAQNDNMVSINGAMQVDLMGQVCAESIGPRQFSGTGGQADFVRGANWSKGGMSFLCLPSTLTTKSGEVKSKISCALPLGSVVTTPRADVQYIVTEYGVADLRNEPLDVRAKRLIAIAHPDFRDQLTFEAKKAGFIV